MEKIHQQREEEDNTPGNEGNVQDQAPLTLVSSSSSSTEEGEDSSLARFATTASWIVNWALLFLKIIALIMTRSKAVLAAVADSAVDLISQVLLSGAEKHMNAHHPKYPVGRSRLEALSVLGCAAIMIMASIEVVQFSISDIIEGCKGNLPHLFVDKYMYIILGVGIFLKAALYVFCRWSNKTLKSDAMEALTEDHLNDVLSNVVAVITASVAYETTAWWIDAAGGIFISLIIIARWFSIIKEQVKKIIGHTAPAEFIAEVEELARQHHPELIVDCTRAYHFGARYNVEMEIVLPSEMTVMESHDISLALQHKIEELSDVERAFVHIDHQLRDGLEHKIERELLNKTKLDKVVVCPTGF